MASERTVVPHQPTVPANQDRAQLLAHCSIEMHSNATTGNRSKRLRPRHCRPCLQCDGLSAVHRLHVFGGTATHEERERGGGGEGRKGGGVKEPQRADGKTCKPGAQIGLASYKSTLQHRAQFET